MWLGLAVLAVMVGLTRWHNGRVDDAVERERTTDPIDNRSIDVPSTELSAIASKMRAQVGHLQDKVNIDAATVNDQ